MADLLPEAAEAGPGPGGGEPSSSELAESLLDLISAVRRGIRRSGGRPAVYASLTGAQLELVRQLRRHPETSVATLALALGVAPNTVSSLVRELSDRGLLLRGTDPSDRRVARLSLTPAMREGAEAWHDQRVATLARALQRLGQGERSQLIAALPALGRLEAELEAGRAG